METKEYRTVDKSTWGHGPWMDEPDKMQFPDPATGLPCLIVRNGGGALCGYVGVPEGHPWHGRDDCGGWGDDYPEVHGGITFGGPCQPGAKEDRHVCHVPAPGEPDHVWWLGFDCAHSGDLSPRYEGHRQDWYRGTYRDLDYVKCEIARLAAQCATAQEGK